MVSADARSIAYDILIRVSEGAFADLALDGELEKHPQLDSRDRGLATELVYGVLRHRRRLDFVLQSFCSKPLDRVDAGVLELLRLGCYQLLLLDRIPQRAAVYETVELARRRRMQRATGFINGILRAVIREGQGLTWPDAETEPLAYLETVLSLPDWLARRWLDDLGPEQAQALATAMLAPAPVCLRANTLRTDRARLQNDLARQDCLSEPTRFAAEGLRVLSGMSRHLPGTKEGWWQKQDEASMLIAHLLNPQPGERILDACAAPGGKTTHMAALTHNLAGILAMDLHPQRLKLVEQGAKRLGCQGIETRAWDLTSPPTFLEAGSFHRILVDAPCSGLGVLRRNPEIRWRRRPEELAQLAQRQLAILRNVAPLVRPGGRLLYSLCTFGREETDDVCDAFLAACPEFEREDLRPGLPAGWRPLFDESGALRTWPHRHDGMDGFFAAAFRRRG